MLYQINLHAHTRYSDGAGTIEIMARECKKLGFSACVITDHVYSQDADYSLNMEKWTDQIIEAAEVSYRLEYPIIIGCEFSIQQYEEVLVFGSKAIHELLSLRDKRTKLGVNPTIQIQDLRRVRERYDCATILCHPCLASYDNKPNFIEAGGVEILDGYEYYNSGEVGFDKTREVPIEFKDLTPFSNSDAHNPMTLEWNYNEVERCIMDEVQLIQYIKSKKPVTLVNNCRVNDPLLGRGPWKYGDS